MKRNILLFKGNTSKIKNSILAHFLQFFLFLFAFCFVSPTAHTQILYDIPTQNLVLEAIDHIYNYEFGEVEPVARQIRAKYPNHPVNSMLKAMQLQWQYLPVKDNKGVSGQYLSLLHDCLAKAKVLEKNEKTRPEAAFFSMAGHGYIALMHNYNGDKLKAVSEAKQAYDYVMEGFKYMDKNPEFYFSSGLYNYYVIRYPEDHPIVKPMLFFFKDGNREEGLRQMDVAARKGVFTRTESAFYLARIFLKHELRYERAGVYLASLTQKYPNNPIFLMKYTEALLLLNKYEEAKPYLERLTKRTDKFFPIIWRTFEGLIQEKHLKNDQEAVKFYQAALRQSYDDEYTKEYHAFSYAGLARIALRAGDRKKAIGYYKKVEELAEYKALLKEAKDFFR
ncbi:lipopolysaccharide assembly protein LapB [Runella sp.]|jgi:tetratricopeptide (TPR) repeat protein|uniref:tetratricopeptide repeat protein n=1 Tax=Runella sp. TaxID=1960881 RepID=UPI0026314989|nr:tetratricopeptide repeat protein [Runella sp.]